jgi:hypothetical protein
MYEKKASDKNRHGETSPANPSTDIPDFGHSLSACSILIDQKKRPAKKSRSEPPIQPFNFTRRLKQ